MAIIANPINYVKGPTTTSYTIGTTNRATWKETFYSSKQGQIDTDFRINKTLGSLKYTDYTRSESYKRDGYEIRRPWSWDPSFTQGFSYALAATTGCPLSLSEMEERATEFFYKNAGNLTKMELGVSLLEARKTFGLIASTALRLGSAFRNLRKGRVNEAFSALGVSGNTVVPYHLRGFGNKRVTARDHIKKLNRDKRNSSSLLDFAASSWLEIRYGWTPLLYDVYSAAELVAHLMYNEVPDIHLSGVYVWEGSATNPAYGVSGTERHLVRLDHFFVIEDQSLRNTNAMGLLNPASIAWELTPFSFVIDWFLPIGDYLESFTALAGLRHLHGGRTYVRELDQELWLKNTSTWVQNAIYQDFYMERASKPVPSVPVPRFSLTERLNGHRVIDALALLKGIFGR